VLYKQGVIERVHLFWAGRFRLCRERMMKRWLLLSGEQPKTKPIFAWINTVCPQAFCEKFLAELL
jgi:hypothetical protein